MIVPAAVASTSTGGSRSLLFILQHHLHDPDHPSWCARPDGMQNEVEEHYSDLMGRASDALGNVAWCRASCRVEAEVAARCAASATSLLAAQMPVLSWWAMVAVMTRARPRSPILGDLHRRHLAARPEPRDHRRDRDVRELRDHADPAARAGRLLRQQPPLLEAPRLAWNSSTCSTRCRRCTTATTPSTPAASRASSNSGNVSFSYDGKRPAVEDV